MINFLLMLLGQIIVYMLIMLGDEYAGFLLAVIIGAICFGIWLISLIVEWIEPSRVNKNYYRYMLAGWMGPALALLGFILLRGEISWLT